MVEVIFKTVTFYIPVQLFREHYPWDTTEIVDSRFGIGKVTPWLVS